MTTIPKPNRREFLYYMGGASLALASTGVCAGLRWFTSVQLRYPGDNSARFPLDVDTVLQKTDHPIWQSRSRIWLVNTEKGLLALNAKCVLHGVLVKWVPANYRFECPACGSHYTLQGAFIDGPARRGLDRFVVEVTIQTGTRRTPPNGDPVPVDGATSLVIDTSQAIRIGRDGRPLSLP
jgi:cytochrome b6-f complex iron-sulfur subunit